LDDSNNVYNTSYLYDDRSLLIYYEFSWKVTSIAVDWENEHSNWLTDMGYMGCFLLPSILLTSLYGCVPLKYLKDSLKFIGDHNYQKGGLQNMTCIKILIAAILCLSIGSMCDELGGATDIENFPTTADIESLPGEESAEARFEAGMGSAWTGGLSWVEQRQSEELASFLSDEAVGEETIPTQICFTIINDTAIYSILMGHNVTLALNATGQAVVLADGSPIGYLQPIEG
jgi:hypothetical protein